MIRKQGRGGFFTVSRQPSPRQAVSPITLPGISLAGFASRHAEVWFHIMEMEKPLRLSVSILSNTRVQEGALLAMVKGIQVVAGQPATAKPAYAGAGPARQGSWIPRPAPTHLTPPDYRKMETNLCTVRTPARAVAP